MNYLTKILGIQIEHEKAEFSGLPNLINSRYKLQMVALDGQKAIFIYPKEGLEQIKALRSRIARIIKEYAYPVVLILKTITSRQKEYLIKDKIPFIVEGKQIYLPFMAVYLQQKSDREQIPGKKLLPSSQLLLLWFLYHGANELPTSLASRELNLTPTSISRASKQLESLGILKVKKAGVQKILYTDQEAKELFERVKDQLENPKKRTVYIPKELVTEDLLESNLTALSEYSMINESAVKYYAVCSISKWKDSMTDYLIDSDLQVVVELWKYDPRILSVNKMVDPLSLALSLKDEEDERVEEAVEEMVDALWRTDTKW